MQTLGHLNALKAFEAAARHLSFTEAAAELGVTPAAVGLHVRTLEAYLGLKLFIRAERRLVLSDDAAAVVAEIREGLDKLSNAMQRLHEQARRSMLTISVPPSFGARWLMPRLKGFHSSNPSVSLRVDTGERLVDLQRENFDFAVRFGCGPYPSLQATALLDEWVLPVCSPSLLKRVGPLRSPEDLASLTLIHDTTVAYDRSFPTWKSWLRAAGVPESTGFRIMSVNSSIMAVQAALEGQGVTLGRAVLVLDDVKAGRLVKALPVADKADARYWIVNAPERRCSAAAMTLRDWLIGQAKPFNKAMSRCLR